MLLGKQIFGLTIRRRHGVAALALLLGLGLILAWTLLPSAGLRWGLIRTLHGFGMVEVSVSAADLSLFHGNVVVRQMVARPPEGEALGVKDFALRFRWRPLLDKRVVLDRVALEGVEIQVRREGGGLVINGLPLAVAAAPPGQAESRWGIDVAALDLSNSRLIVMDGDAKAEIAVRTLTVENLHSRDPANAPSFALQGTLNGADITLTGSVSPFAATPSFTLDAVLRGLDLAPLRAVAARAGLGGLGGRADLSLSVAGTLRESGLAVRGTGKLEVLAPTVATTLATPAAVPAARLALNLRRADWDGHRLELAGSLDATDLRGKGAGGEGSAATLTLEADRLGWDGKLDWQGSLGLTGGRLVTADGEVQPESLAWTGHLGLDPGGDSPSGRAEGRLDLGPLRLSVADTAIGQKHAVIEGWAEFGHAAPVTAGLTLTAEGLTASQPVSGQGWLALERLTLSGFKATADGASSAERLTIGGLAALKRDGKAGYPWRIEARALRLDHLARNGDGDMAVAEARLDGLTARLTRTKDGLLGVPAAPAKAPARQEDEDAPGLSLGRLVVGGNSRIVFEDRSSAETVRLEAQPVELALADLDSDRPDRDSSFDLRATIGEARIVATGQARPFAESLSGRIDGHITALELPPLSPYLAQALGIHLQTGHFDGTFNGGIARGALNGKLNLELSNLFIAPPDPGAPIAKKMDMPIGTVLDLLRDSEDRIRLSLPIGGDLANPDLDISDAVAQAVAGALKSTVLTTLKLAFPVATLISMAVDAEDSARLALAPLGFAAGADTLSDAHRETLGKIAELMRARPGLTLTLCGKADATDWPVLVERQRAEDKPFVVRLERMAGVQRTAADAGPPNPDILAGLAGTRADLAKAFLVDKAGIDPGRLFACRPEVDPAASGGKGPRVELLL